MSVVAYLGAFVADSTVEEYLLFSDGLANFGARPFAAPRVPLYSVSAANRSDPALLTRIAEDSGGRYIDLIADSATEAPPMAPATSCCVRRTRVRAASKLRDNSLKRRPACA